MPSWLLATVCFMVSIQSEAATSKRSVSQSGATLGSSQWGSPKGHSALNSRSVAVSQVKPQCSEPGSSGNWADMKIQRMFDYSWLLFSCLFETSFSLLPLLLYETHLTLERNLNSISLSLWLSYTNTAKNKEFKWIAPPTGGLGAISLSFQTRVRWRWITRATMFACLSALNIRHLMFCVGCFIFFLSSLEFFSSHTEPSWGPVAESSRL